MSKLELKPLAIGDSVHEKTKLILYCLENNITCYSYQREQGLYIEITRDKVRYVVGDDSDLRLFLENGKQGAYSSIWRAGRNQGVAFSKGEFKWLHT